MSTNRTMLAVLCGGILAGAGAWAAEDLFERAPWSVSLGLGYAQFEGDELVENGGALDLKLGYDFNPRWAAEIGLALAPSLDARAFEDNRPHLDDSTYMLRLGADLQYHLRNVEDLRWDPYLAVGVGLANYGEDLKSGDSAEGFVEAGGGVFYHLNDEWALRADARLALAGGDTEVKTLYTVGANWRWGARAAAGYRVGGGEIDSDGDGLFDSEEKTYGTDPYDPDTDRDGLTDGPEVKEYKTDPLNADSDWDALKDGAEVLTYKTNPLKADTDDGGVTDGHEVIEDGTNPLNPKDDLMLITLNIEFDYDKADLRPIYFDQLDVVVKVLQRDPGATARVEGHADKRKTSVRSYNLRLSDRRAKAVADYLVSVGGINRSRLTYKGYGFDRPVAPNDTEANMQKNRRTEIYIRKAGQAEAGGAKLILDNPVDGVGAPKDAAPVKTPAPAGRRPAAGIK